MLWIAFISLTIAIALEIGAVEKRLKKLEKNTKE